MVDRTIRRKAGGIYVLSAKAGDTFTTQRIGRSDDDIASALKGFIGLYSHFSWAHASSPRHAFEMECALYHAEKRPESTSHPAKTNGTDWVCPVCGE